MLELPAKAKDSNARVGIVTRWLGGVKSGMHPGNFISGGDDDGFGGGQLGEASVDHLIRSEILGQANVGAVVPGLRLKQAAVERAQLRIEDVIAEQRETLATASFDQSSHEQTIDRTARLHFPDQLVQPRSVTA